MYRSFLQAFYSARDQCYTPRILDYLNVISVSDIRTLVGSPILIISELYIDDKALYQCCPQLNDIKSLLDCGRKQSYRSVPTKTAKAISERQSNEVAVEVSC